MPGTARPNRRQRFTWLRRLLPQPEFGGSVPWRTPGLTLLIFGGGLSAPLLAVNYFVGDLLFEAAQAPVAVGLGAMWFWWLKEPRNRTWSTVAGVVVFCVLGVLQVDGFSAEGNRLFSAWVSALAAVYAFAGITHVPGDPPALDED